MDNKVHFLIEGIGFQAGIFRAYCNRRLDAPAGAEDFATVTCLRCLKLAHGDPAADARLAEVTR